MTGRHRILRLAAALAFVLPVILASVGISSAHPTKSQVDAAKAKLELLNGNLGLLIEQYDQAKLKLQETQSQLDAMRQAKVEADAQVASYQEQLALRAVAVYTGTGSQWDALLNAQSFAEFSDRLQYIGALAGSDADLAAQTAAAGQKAQWAAERLKTAVAAQQSQQKALLDRVAQIKQMVAQQAHLYNQLNQSYKDFLAAERAAELAAAGGSPWWGGYSGFTPPPNASAAQVAIAAAQSVVGATYVWGSSDPNVGFDCSGFTMWSWSRAGVSLPHSSAAQYSVLPHVSRDQLAPGDLLFFYSPISHVGMYLGGGAMIDASHPGPGGGVAIRPVYWQYYVGAGRPG